VGRNIDGITWSDFLEHTEFERVALFVELSRAIERSNELVELERGKGRR
jgi:hypothetical protein